MKKKVLRAEKRWIIREFAPVMMESARAERYNGNMRHNTGTAEIPAPEREQKSRFHVKFVLPNVYYTLIFIK